MLCSPGITLGETRELRFSLGYHTGIVGKWHLGLGDGMVDWNKKVSPGPNEVGFDYSYIMAATQDRVPTVYIEDGHVRNLDPNDPIEISYKENFEGEPTGKSARETLKMDWHHGHNMSIVNGIGRIGFMKGGDSAKWVDENMADTFLVRAQNYVIDHKDDPFFLYYALQQPHVPRTPHPRFVGKSGMGPRGDVIVEADWCIGEFVKTLEEEGLLENTLIIFSSDNGPVLNDGYYDDAVEKITTSAMVSQVDLLSSLAALVGSDVRGTDSKEMLDVFMGKSDRGRDELILEATSRTAYRKGDWAFIPAYDGRAINTFVNIELGNSKEPMLFNLAEDLSQQNNLADSEPEKLAEMISSFEAIRGTGYKKTEKLILK